MSERLSRRTKLLYGVGDTGFSLTSTIIGAYLAIFLSRSPTLILVALVLPLSVILVLGRRFSSGADHKRQGRWL